MIAFLIETARTAQEDQVSARILLNYDDSQGFPGDTSDKKPTNARDKRHGFDPWVGEFPWRRAWQPTPAFLPGESTAQRSLVGYSPQGCKELDTAEMTQQDDS